MKQKQLLKKKHEIRKQYGSTSASYKISKAETKKLVRKDKLRYIENSISKLFYQVNNTMLPSKTSKLILRTLAGASKTKTIPS